MNELTSLRNLGAEMVKKLNAIDIFTAEDLIKTGSKDAFSKMKFHFPNVCLVHLYTLEGAISDTDYNQLPEETKKDLKAYCDSLK